LSWVTSHGEELDRSRNKIDELEHKLVKEEADLEEIRDSLKGMFALLGHADTLRQDASIHDQD
jgi:hypothetical protein